MKKIFVNFLMIAFCLCLVVLCSCSHGSNTYDVYRKYAYDTDNEGWFYMFSREGFCDKDADESDLYKYHFFGMNLRYRFDERYVDTIQHGEKDSVVTERILSGVLLFGAGPDKEKQDRAVIENLFSEAREKEGNAGDELLLNLSSSDYKFEVLDKGMFFSLMREALSSEPKQPGPNKSYRELPSFAMLCEPDYIDGYKFQVAFVNEMASVDGLFIDVLYKVGDGYKDYVQLSDLVESSSATKEQKQAFGLIEEITSGITKNDSFDFGSDSYRHKVIGKINFARLNTFLQDIHKGNKHLQKYITEPVILEEITP